MISRLERTWENERRAFVVWGLVAAMVLLANGRAPVAAQSGSASPLNLTVSLPSAIDPDRNNVELLGGGEYAVVAPFGDTGWLLPEAGSPAAEQSDVERAVGGSNLVWSIDTATGAKIDQAVVGYFPSRIAVNREAGIVVVRHLGMKFADDGSFVPQATVSVLKLDEQGRLALQFSSVIPGVGDAASEPADGAAPDDVFVSQDGRYVFATNGASVFAYDASNGKRVDSFEVVNPLLYGEQNEITSLSYHAASGTFGVISGNAIYANDVGPDSFNSSLPPVASVDTVTMFRFGVPAAAPGAPPDAPPPVPSFTLVQKMFFNDYGISAGSNVEFNEDASAAFLYSAKLGLIVAIDVRTGIVTASVKVDFIARDNDDMKSVRTLVYSPQSRTLSIAVTGKRITHPSELARRITHPSELARRITHPSEFAIRITHPSERALRRESVATGTVSPRVYLAADFGRGSLVSGYSYTLATGETISAAQFADRGLKGYFTATDGHLYSFDVVNGTLEGAGAPGTVSSAPAVSEQFSRAALLAGPDVAAGQSATAGGSVTVVRTGSR